MIRLRRLVVLVIAAIVLAGCSKAEDSDIDGAEGGDAATPGGVPPLGGWVFDPAVAPVVGATVSIPSLGLEATTDGQGHYGFTDVPAEQTLVVIVTAEGYRPGSKSLQLDPGTAVRLNFTLEPVPVKKAYHETQSFTGMIDCAGVVKAEGNRYEVPCSPGVGVDNRVWEFNVKEDLASLIVEVVWEANSGAADHLNLTIETLDRGELDEVLFTQEDGSILRGQISQSDAQRFYSGGGKVRVSIDIGRNVEDEEAGAGAGIAAQQEFEVFATAFYVEPGPPSFTVADAA